MTARLHLPLPQQILEIQPLGKHRKRAGPACAAIGVPSAGPGRAFDAVLVGVAQIQRFANAVIAGEPSSSMPALSTRWSASVPAPGGSGRGSRCRDSPVVPGGKADSRLCSPRC